MILGSMIENDKVKRKSIGKAKNSRLIVFLPLRTINSSATMQIDARIVCYHSIIGETSEKNTSTLLDVK